MWQQIRAVLWAQFRIARNHLPRTSAGSIFSWLALSVWYGLYCFAATEAVLKIPEASLPELARYLPAGLLGIFLFWQIVPLFTLSSGWSLQLDKLQMYPLRDISLFALETLLRLTSAPEMLIVLAGIGFGLARHPHLNAAAPLALLLFVPFNLFLQLAIRDLILHSFERNRFRELFAVLIIGIAVLPQFLLRTGAGHKSLPYLLSIGHAPYAPWRAVSALSLGNFSLADFAAVLAWIGLAFLFARLVFSRSLRPEDSFRTASAKASRSGIYSQWSTWPARVFSDPVAALVQKELQSLVRMPKFRVIFGMACLLGIIVFVPGARNGHDPAAHFMRNNLIPAVNLYGLLLLSDILLLNTFGLDRSAAQTYFVTPVSLVSVLKAKNLAAIVFVLVQTAIILFIASLARVPITLTNVGSGLLASGVVTVFLLTIGNYTSCALPRPIDPKQTFKKQAGAKMQIWLLGCTIALFVLVGFAFLARYALQSDWALFAVLSAEFVVGLIVYRFGLDSAAARGLRSRESIIQALSRNASPMDMGS